MIIVGSIFLFIGLFVFKLDFRTGHNYTEIDTDDENQNEDEDLKKS